ncbi:Immunoglobulin-like domain [Trinorchestia longiramus]|nr:Immunoglobulin-like domain [Trinorchestia longiramus]
MSQNSLVLQKLKRNSTGEYVCAATNIIGTGRSEPIVLVVQYAPVCRVFESEVQVAGRLDSLNVSCEVDAFPPPTSFRWAFNTSTEIVSIDSGKMEAVGGDLRNVLYTPRSKVDFGSLLCWASNVVGEQRHPCVFHVVHSSPPEPVQNCTVSNVSRTTVTVRCQAGWDGGLQQTFTLSVSQNSISIPTSAANSSNGTSPRVLANTSSSPKAEFTVTGLLPGKAYVLTIAAVNSRGQSSPVRVTLETLQDKAQERTSPGVPQRDIDRLPIGPIIAVMIGALASLTLSCVVIVLVIRARRSDVPKRCSKVYGDRDVADTQSVANQMEASFTTFLEAGDSSPDLIPYCSEAVTVKAGTPAAGNLTFNQLSLMDAGKPTSSGEVGRRGHVEQVGYRAAPEQVLHRTASLPRSGHYKHPRDRFYQQPLSQDFSRQASNSKSHASLHSLYPLETNIKYISAVKFSNEIPTTRPASVAPQASRPGNECSLPLASRQISRNGSGQFNERLPRNSDPSTASSRFSRPPTHHLPQSQMRHCAHQGSINSPYELSSSKLHSPTMGDNSGLPYSPSPTSTTPSEYSSRPEKERNIRTLSRLPEQHFSTKRVRSPASDSSRTQTPDVSAANPDVTQILSNQAGQSAMPGARAPQTPLKGDIDCSDESFSATETFFSPPPMFSNSPDPLEGVEN